MKIKDMLPFLLLPIIFAIAPEENRSILFRASPDTMYGEIEFTLGGGNYVLAKNISGQNLVFRDRQVEVVAWRHLGDRSLFSESAPKDLPSKSCAIFLEKPRNAIPIMYNSGKESFSPQPLVLLTPFEDDQRFFLLFLAGTFGIILTVLLIKFSGCFYHENLCE